jgi:hypothetical protein
VYELELIAAGYLGVGAIAALVLWLFQRRQPLRGAADESDRYPPLPVVLAVAGLAWPISLPLATYDMLRQARKTRSAPR